MNQFIFLRKQPERNMHYPIEADLGMFFKIIINFGLGGACAQGAPWSGTLFCFKNHLFHKGDFQKLAFRSRMERIGTEKITKEASKMSNVGDKDMSRNV